jgi:hypothetical protein
MFSNYFLTIGLGIGLQNDVYRFTYVNKIDDIAINDPFSFTTYEAILPILWSKRFFVQNKTKLNIGIGSII